MKVDLFYLKLAVHRLISVLECCCNGFCAVSFSLHSSYIFSYTANITSLPFEEHGCPENARKICLTSRNVPRTEKERHVARFNREVSLRGIFRR